MSLILFRTELGVVTAVTYCTLSGVTFPPLPVVYLSVDLVVMIKILLLAFKKHLWNKKNNSVHVAAAFLTIPLLLFTDDDLVPFLLSSYKRDFLFGV